MSFVKQTWMLWNMTYFTAIQIIWMGNLKSKVEQRLTARPDGFLAPISGVSLLVPFRSDFFPTTF